MLTPCAVQGGVIKETSVSVTAMLDSQYTKKAGKAFMRNRGAILRLQSQLVVIWGWLWLKNSRKTKQSQSASGSTGSKRQKTPISEKSMN